MSQTLDRTGIAALIPHSGSMCLLARLQSWDAQRIACMATNHRDAEHPLRTASGLMSPCAIEYAAQAMALHGALIGQDAGTIASPGFLASARGVQLHVLRLDDLPPAEVDEPTSKPPARAAMRARSSTASRSATPAACSPKGGPRSCSTRLCPCRRAFRFHPYEHFRSQTRSRHGRQWRPRPRHRPAPGA
ncbi:hypothetical protein LRS03_21050 [Rhizobacter sp. J219]|uniref:hypothetical protein n=1 Tax=Rhizobacter sp. J219 TaxID=2898430 RepID=UPI002151F84F|nr:hypothetical protein [Rhizobacter sp. J219]MCR5885210.1 hypothetical protein [Rhizobacter sp. J219]